MKTNMETKSNNKESNFDDLKLQVLDENEMKNINGGVKLMMLDGKWVFVCD